MKKIFLSIALAITMANLNAQELRTKLETSYAGLYNAIQTKDAAKFKKSLSSVSYVTVKNQMLSMGMKFPDDFYANALQAYPDISKLNYIKSVSNGPTAFGIYSGVSKSGEPTLYIFKFYEEEKDWKFSQLSQENSQEIVKNLNAKVFDFLSAAKYQPDGIVPATPQEIIPGDYKAVIDVKGYGFIIDVQVNGNVQKKVNGGSYSGAILGGIKKGTNKIELIINPKSGEDGSDVTISIRALINGGEKEVFSFTETAPKGKISKEFSVQ